MSQPRTTLFLGDLPAHCVENDICGLFGQYGEIAEIKIMRSEENFRNLSYGFVKFVDPISAEKALVASEGLQLGGRHLKVGWASHKTKKETKNSSQKDKANSSSVHISYISYQLTNLINEDSLRKLFEKYGTVLDCAIKKSYIDENINRQCGYGFVHFSSDKEGIDSALAAVAGLNDATLDNVCYKCSISHNLEKQLLEMQRNAQNAGSFPMQPVVEDMKTPRPRIQQHAPINPNYRVASAVAPTMRVPTRTVDVENNDSRFLLESSFAARQQQQHQHQHLQQHQSQYHQQQQQLAQVHVRPQQDFHPSSRPPRIVSATSSMHGSFNGNQQGQLSTSPSLLSGSSSSFDLALPSPQLSAKDVSFPPSMNASASSSSNLFSSVSSIGLFDSFTFDAPSTPATTIGASSSSSTSFFGDFPSHGFDSHASSAKSNHSMFSMKSLTSELSEVPSSFSSSPSTSQHHQHHHLGQSSQQVPLQQQQHAQQPHQHHTGLGLLDHVFHFSSLRSSHHHAASESNNSSRLSTPTAADASSHHEKSSFFGVLSHRDHSHEDDHAISGQKNHHQHHQQHHHNHHSLFEFSLFDRPPFHRHHHAQHSPATASLSSSPSLGASLSGGESLNLHHHHHLHHNHHASSSLEHSNSSSSNGHRGMLSSLF